MSVRRPIFRAGISRAAMRFSKVRTQMPSAWAACFFPIRIGATDDVSVVTRRAYALSRVGDGDILPKKSVGRNVLLGPVGVSADGASLGRVDAHFFAGRAQDGFYCSVVGVSGGFLHVSANVI